MTTEVKRGRGKVVVWMLVGVLIGFSLQSAGCGFRSRGDRDGRHHDRGGRHHGQMDHMDPEHLEEMVAWIGDQHDLTDEQQAELVTSLNAAAEQAAELKKERDALEAELREIVVQEQFSEADREALTERVKALADRTVDTFVDVLADAMQILSVDQRRELATHWESRR